MPLGICTAYDGPAGPGMGDVCLYDSCGPYTCTRLEITLGQRREEPENVDARNYRDELAQRAWTPEES